MTDRILHDHYQAWLYPLLTPAARLAIWVRSHNTELNHVGMPKPLGDDIHALALAVNEELTTRWETLYLSLFEMGIKFTMTDSDGQALVFSCLKPGEREAFDTKDQIWVESFDYKTATAVIATKDDWRASWPDDYPNVQDGDVYRVTICFKGE